MLREKLATMSRYENELRAQGVVRIAGVDEVGRGPLAGPVCAAAVVLPQDFDVLGVDDSKKLSEKKREALYERIVERALAWGIGMTDNRRIDEINILNATKEAMLAALAEAGKRLKFPIERVLIDAVELPESGIPGIAIIKGDEKSVSVAAASIVAKVTRDRLMAEFDAVYQGYGFASNKGYGTKTHYESIAKLGLTPIHRRTFLRGSHSVFSR
ncbi:MAG: ribonuclease HII [Clostridiales Family XIII bacterium]|nr:ribonuclease HII [Clostridiales Family XIII bacterium]